jgi:hypothetical protein
MGEIFATPYVRGQVLHRENPPRICDNKTKRVENKDMQYSVLS